MIPKFPEFKKLELSDKNDIENFTSKYPPYSDFNFVSMWCWNIKDEMRISVLNSNLVVRFTDYLTGDLFYSFLGDNMVNETVEKILMLSIKEGLPIMLKLVPENSIKALDVSKFKIEEDLDNFDYIYKNLDLKDLKGNKFNSKRGEINRLLRKYTDLRIETIDIIKNKELILGLTKDWFEHRVAVSGYKDFINEMFAIDRLLDYNLMDSSLFTIGLFSEEKLIGYVINEILPNEINIIHFEKTDLDYSGAHSFIMKNNASFFLEKGTNYLNYEQDLGLIALKRSKKSLRPVSFLKKFIIKLK